jgi:hypothetical protein
MGPPTDVVMRPPPPPLPVAQQPPPAPPKDNQEIVDKYRRLKRKYFELEDVRKPSFIVIIIGIYSTHKFISET